MGQTSKLSIIVAVICLVFFPKVYARSVKERKADRGLIDKVAAWQLDNPVHNPKDWINGAFYRGLVEWSEYTGNKTFLDSLKAIGDRNRWDLLDRRYHADDQCVIQMYAAMYRMYGDPDMIRPSKYRMDRVVMNPSSVVIRKGERNASQRWSWCDALFMAPPVLVDMYNLFKDDRYLMFLDREYKVTYDLLYSKEYHLFFRDLNFIDRKEANGKPVFWGRGNAWVVAGLAIILEALPENYRNYDFYLQLYKEMCASLLRYQNESGSWHSSLLDSQSFPLPESSASAFITYAFAWGVNQGVLKDAAYKKAALKGWDALKSYVSEDGKLGYVQRMAAAPGMTGPEICEPYGVGAFLLAGKQMMMMK